MRGAWEACGGFHECSRAYFKQSLQLQREQQISIFWSLRTNFVKNVCQPFFLVIQYKFRKKSTCFLSFASIFACPQASYNCTPQFLMTFSPSFPRNFSFFSPVFDPYTYKVTTTTAQFTFYNCKLHFTTAEIVISYTLKYALA